MMETDIIFSPVLDSFLEIRYNTAISSVRFIGSGNKPVRKRVKTSFELEEYFRGERFEFSCDVDLSGLSDFTRRVLEETRKIKYGTTITYSELARRIKSSAVRAVGGALGRNPVPIIIPCHRVVAKNGIGGYSSGVDVKIKLLELERKHLQYFRFSLVPNKQL
ncbi:Methylated-DNA--protein-cysteine methyltransferase [uncultured archaeon]|nr:Methylated-DNA--protein-cysteine methyltransferase [uncultured archaeon]